MSMEPPRTCYIAAAMSSVPDDKRPELRKKREAIATFFRDGYSIVCSHYKVLYAEPESGGPTSNPEYAERVSIVARDLTLVNAAEIVVLCFEGREIYSWGAAIELGYAYGCGKRIVIFNLSDEDTYFFMKYLPQDANHEVYIIEDEQSLKKFTQEYKPDGCLPDKVDEARKQLEEVLQLEGTTPSLTQQL